MEVKQTSRNGTSLHLGSFCILPFWVICILLIFDQVDNKDMKEGTIKIVRVNFATLNMMLDSLPY